MKQNKDVWVEEVVNSTEGMVPARPRADLYADIRARLGRELTKSRRIPAGVMSAAAACLLVLFALNVTVIFNYVKADTEQAQVEEGAGMDALIEYYELGSNSAGI